VHPEAITTISTYLTSISHESPEKIRERIQKLSQKQTAWMLTVRLTATTRDLIEKLNQRFLRQYQTLAQYWVISEITEVIMLDRTMSLHNLISTDELVALAHFPEAALL
jgi:hypothetical protein